MGVCKKPGYDEDLYHISPYFLHGVPLEAKYTKRQKTIIKKFKKQRQIAYDLEVELNSLNSTLDTLKKLTEVSTRHRFNVDSLTVVDATFTGTQCGPFHTQQLYNKHQLVQCC